VFLRVRKRDANTQWVAQQLAGFAGISAKNIGYAGLKDRHAVAEQWFSLQLPKTEPDWSDCHGENFTVLEYIRNNRKLRQGALAGNQFRIVIRELQGEADLAELERRIDIIRRAGVPNYFGEQRFGHDGGNIGQAIAMFEQKIKVRDHYRRGLYLSAARSWLFNQVLSQRVANATWNQVLAGDVMMLDGSHSVFLAEQITPDIEQRVSGFDIHPTGPLWGEGELMSRGESASLEQTVLEDYELLRGGLIRAGLKQERRALRVRPNALTLDPLSDASVCLHFFLPAGSYATSVLRECCETATKLSEL
jgi:tRNA pseudouridine13 synthase